MCRSCGLTDSLCCCTECAYSCHRGHDCVFKKASPTAYCDCWERCSCRCLAQTPDSTRLTLLQKLMTHTSLATRVSLSCLAELTGLMSLPLHLTVGCLSPESVGCSAGNDYPPVSSPEPLVHDPFLFSPFPFQT